MMDALLGVLVVLEAAALVLLLRRGSGGREAASLGATLRQEIATQIQAEVRALREETSREARQGRDELGTSLTRMSREIGGSVTEQFTHQATQQKLLLETFTAQIAELTRMNETKLERVRSVVEERLSKLQEENSQKLDLMRQTVDEKLHATLEARLTESFRQVSERLEAVQRGLGEMQTLATHVGDLRRVLTNVKARGTFGEVQLAMLLAETLSPEQYATNVSTKVGTNDRVEFAVRLPGQGEGADPVFLPIDCKFPIEDYQRMLEAQDSADPDAFERSSKALIARVRQEAKTISQKYLDPPHTTEFAILYLPIEGLFAEVLRNPGLMESIQHDYRVVVAGPTTLTALLTSLQMGFRTLAIQKRSSEVWELLGAIKTQFGTFGELLAKTKKKLDEASHSIDSAQSRSRTIVRKLRGVEALPTARADAILPASDDIMGAEAEAEGEAEEAGVGAIGRP